MRFAARRSVAAELMNTELAEKVVLVAGAEPSRELAGDILAFCRDNLAPYKRIRRLEFADLPKTISGKIRRVELRQAEAGHAGQRPSGEYREEDFG